VTAGGESRRGRAGFVIALLLGLLIVAWAAGRPPTDGDPLDPRSSAEFGARGLVLFLDELGADVDISATGPSSATDVAVLLEDRLTESARRDLATWVEGGGTLVIADPGSPLSAPLAEDGNDVLTAITGDIARGTCDLDELDDVTDIDAPGALLYDAEAVDGQCFGDDRAAYVVSGAVGAGRVISVGSPTPFLNDALDDRDHALLAAGLIGSEDGVRVTVLERPAPGEGDKGLTDLVSDGVKAALVQLALAFVVYALFRARRLGRPVPEPLPVPIAGSELTAAVGELMQQRRDPTRAARVIQQDTRRHLARRLGLPVNAPASAVADAVSARVDTTADHVLDLLNRPSVEDERALVDLVRDLDAIRQETLHDRSV
jgi:hypothetical protein